MWRPFARAPPAWDLSPLRSESPGSQYRSYFAAECEAIVLRLGHAQSRALPSPTPSRRPSTVEGERLTPLEPSYSFFGASMPGPAEEQSGQGAGPPPTPSTPRNRTYDADALLEDDPDPDPHRTFEEAPVSFGASTPVPSTGNFFPPTPPPKKQQGATRPPGSDLLDKARLGGGGTRLAPPKGVPGRKRPAAAGGAPRKSTAGPETAGGAGAKSQLPLGQKPPHDRKSSLSKLPCNKKTPVPLRPPSRPSRGPGVLTGLAQPGVGGKREPPGSKLPVPAAAGSNKANPKRPLERRWVQGPPPPQKQSASKRSCPGRSHAEKPPYGVLLDAGQIPRAAVGSRPTAPCSQCQLLAGEIWKLRSMVEECERTIAMLKQKMPDEED